MRKIRLTSVKIEVFGKPCKTKDSEFSERQKFKFKGVEFYDG